MMLFLVVIAVLAILFLIIDIIDVNRFVIRKYEIESEKIDKEYTVIMLADLHNREFGKNNSKIVNAIKAIGPDFICCAGDMIVARPGKPYDIALNLMEEIKDYPVYYGIGNHEYRWKIYPEEYGCIYDEYLNKLREMGICILENDCVTDAKSGIDIHGIMIDREYYKRFKKMNMSSDYILEKSGSYADKKVSILIAHNPEYFDAYAESGADIVFSGHVHGGIMRIPQIGGVISPRLSLFPKYSGGRYDINKSTMILSCGLGCHTLPLRVFNPGELSVIHLKPCSK